MCLWELWLSRTRSNVTNTPEICGFWVVNEDSFSLKFNLQYKPQLYNKKEQDINIKYKSIQN